MNEGEVEQAFKAVSFDCCADLFKAVGIAPNESEASCATWLFALCSTPLVEVLRAGG